jgi:HK97 family phage major capsid protein/HK97 family phage prohead protease
MPKTMQINRAYSVLTLKAADDDSRIIEGIATTPSPDRMGDIVETDGIEFKLPLPLLYQHNARQPIGKVISAKVSKDGIAIKAQIAGAGVASFIDEAWALIKSGLVRGLSIGFRSLEHAWMDDSEGIRFIRSEWMELSCVTIPANADASILSVKSADALLLAASGHKPQVVRIDLKPNLPGVSGLTRVHKTMTIQEQITQFENKRAASEARMAAIMTKAGETNSTLDEAEQEEYDTLDTEVKSVDEHLVRLRAHEKRLISTAVAVTAENTNDEKKAAVVRGGVVQVKSMLPKGTTFSRWVMAQVEAKGDKYRAPEIAKQLWPDQPEVELILRAGVSAGTSTGTTWASPLIPAAQTMTGEFYDLLRPMSIIGRIPGLNRVPANIIVPVQTGGGTGNWVGETLPKPVSALAFTTATLRWGKAVVLTVLSEELIRFSNPNAEAVVRNSIAKDLAAFEDAQFVGNTIESVNVSPAGIRWNASTSAATGVTAAAFLTDFKTAVGTFITANYDLSKLVILMSSTVAMNVSTLKDSLGNFIYPNLNMQTGGTILGIPVIVSEAVSSNIIFLNANEIMLADDGGITIDASNQASILMDDAPNASPTTTALVSLYQRNLVAIKAEHYLTWKKVRSTSVYFLSNASYTG